MWRRRRRRRRSDRAADHYPAPPCTTTSPAASAGGDNAAAYRYTEAKLQALAVELLDESGVVELIALIGYYGIISMTLNVAQVPLPDGMEDPLRP